MRNHVVLIVFMLVAAFISACAAQTTIEPAPTIQIPGKGGETVPPDRPPAPQGALKEFSLTAKQWSWDPDTITVNKGDTVKLHITSIDVRHGFRLDAFGINQELNPGESVDVEFTADREGEFEFQCSVLCGEGHSDMKGKLIVR